MSESVNTTILIVFLKFSDLLERYLISEIVSRFYYFSNCAELIMKVPSFLDIGTLFLSWYVCCVFYESCLWTGRCGGSPGY
jgi:hypothetical protein